ncbi:acyl carrier protein [Streptomyces sp. ISL-96]|uniref:acyl carrier protein n=1 Tax=Streptomyces sp. ISL-96 TaxID=2819191 RepID=UPI001BEA29A3|nr:phosphopantetheine-binding protein [Streptomyces sp. ISL-96]MBT2493930.1 acyl carrier protein [Streptomyces sp. ISL-96]
MTDAYQALTGFLTDRFDVRPEEMSPRITFAALDLDSLDLAEISVLVHKRYGITLKGVRAATTLAQAADVLQQSWSAPDTAETTAAADVSRA